MNSACQNSDSFGYKPCLNCLRYCYFYCYYYCNCFFCSCCYPYDYNCDINDFTTGSTSCPYPPSISVSDIGDLTGPVDSINVFVAEKLLDLAKDVKTYNFFLIYQVINLII